MEIDNPKIRCLFMLPLLLHQWTCLSLPWSELTWACSVSKWGRVPPYLYWTCVWLFGPTRLTSLTDWADLSLWETKNTFYIISLGTIVLTYNGGFTSTLYMSNYNNDISDRRENIPERRNNKSTIIIIIIIQRISSEVTFSTTLRSSHPTMGWWS